MRQVLMIVIIVVASIGLAQRCGASPVGIRPARTTLCRDGTSSTWAGVLGCWAHRGAR